MPHLRLYKYNNNLRSYVTKPLFMYLCAARLTDESESSLRIRWIQIRPLDSILLLVPYAADIVRNKTVSCQYRCTNTCQEITSDQYHLTIFLSFPIPECLDLILDSRYTGSGTWSVCPFFRCLFRVYISTLLDPAMAGAIVINLALTFYLSYRAIYYSFVVAFLYFAKLFESLQKLENFCPALLSLSLSLSL